ncbi:MAG: site-2 protease family protein [Chloroflexi bacterium]|nr:site-2 protease family protein [Chloroflexota bacterium]
MLNEQSTRNYEYDSQDTPQNTETLSTPESQLPGLRDAIDTVMMVTQVEAPKAPQVAIQYTGQLTVDADEAFDRMQPVFEKLNVHGYFTEKPETHDHQITILQGRYEPKPRPWWPNALLLALTLLSLLFVGSSIQAGADNREVSSLGDLRLYEGWPYALSLILILGAHELGHYFAARRHNVSVTLPYFIPMPFGIFGTLGAFIQLREPMRNRNVLFDVGVAGPLAGLVFAVPILLLGLATSEVQKVPTDEDILREGNSIFYAASKVLVFGRFLPDEESNEDVMINQLAQAGWTGLFVTALNLIPLGQLDGGHVLYTLLGPRAAKLYWPIIGTFVVLSLINSAWILWTILLFMLGRYYARPMEDITPLSTRRRLIGYAAIVILVLIFIPNPLEFIQAE